MPTFRKEVLATCHHKSTDVDDGIPRAFLCKGCHDKIAPEGGTSGRSELRQNAKVAQIEQVKELGNMHKIGLKVQEKATK
jgi:hypothetical protein